MYTAVIVKLHLRDEQTDKETRRLFVRLSVFWH